MVTVTPDFPWCITGEFPEPEKPPTEGGGLFRYVFPTMPGGVVEQEFSPVEGLPVAGPWFFDELPSVTFAWVQGKAWTIANGMVTSQAFGNVGSAVVFEKEGRRRLIYAAPEPLALVESSSIPSGNDRVFARDLCDGRLDIDATCGASTVVGSGEAAPPAGVLWDGAHVLVGTSDAQGKTGTQLRAYRTEELMAATGSAQGSLLLELPPSTGGGPYGQSWGAAGPTESEPGLVLTVLGQINQNWQLGLKATFYAPMADGTLAPVELPGKLLEGTSTLVQTSVFRGPGSTLWVKRQSTAKATFTRLERRSAVTMAP